MDDEFPEIDVTPKRVLRHDPRTDYTGSSFANRRDVAGQPHCHARVLILQHLG